jgi:hypothetical protein
MVSIIMLKAADARRLTPPSAWVVNGGTYKDLERHVIGVIKASRRLRFGLRRHDAAFVALSALGRGLE